MHLITTEIYRNIRNVRQTREYFKLDRAFCFKHDDIKVTRVALCVDFVLFVNDNDNPLTQYVTVNFVLCYYFLVV